MRYKKKKGVYTNRCLKKKIMPVGGIEQTKTKKKTFKNAMSDSSEMNRAIQTFRIKKPQK